MGCALYPGWDINSNGLIKNRSQSLMSLLIKMFFCIFLALMYYHSIGQVSISERTQLDIVCDTIRCRIQAPKVTIEYSLKNLSNENLIFYNLNSKFLHSVTKNRYCDQENTGANVACVIFDQNGNFKSGSYMIITDNRYAITPQRADSLMGLAKKSSKCDGHYQLRWPSIYRTKP